MARRSYGRLVALLAARTRDVAAAEDSLSEAFAAALEDWPARGVPERPEAWLVAVARRKWIDGNRRRQTAERSAGELRALAEELAADAPDPAALPDRRLGLLFACAHPALDARVRAPLILQTVLGFDAAAIGAAFLVSPKAMGQRLVRAKRKIRDAGIPFQVPEGPELAPRLEPVLDALYAAYAEGWSDPSGSDPRRRELAEEAIWLARLVVAALPHEPEALGLLSLVLHAHARRGARREGGRYVPLSEQDPTRWDAEAIDEAEALLARASGLPGDGRYQLEAAVQSAHAVRRFDGDSDWGAIEKLYERLLALTGSPVVAINLAVARAECRSPREGLAALNAVGGDERLAGYQPYWATRAELLARTGDALGAREAYRRAIGLEPDPAVRGFLERRAAAVAPA